LIIFLIAERSPIGFHFDSSDHSIRLFSIGNNETLLIFILTQAVWACGHDPAQGNLYHDAPTCTGRSEIIYAWARDAKKLDLPAQVNFS